MDRKRQKIVSWDTAYCFVTMAQIVHCLRARQKLQDMPVKYETFPV